MADRNILTGDDPRIIYGEPLQNWWMFSDPKYQQKVNFGGNRFTTLTSEAKQMAQLMKNMEPASAVAPATGGLFGALGPAITAIAGQLLNSGGGTISDPGGGIWGGIANIFGGGGAIGGDSPVWNLGSLL